MSSGFLMVSNKFPHHWRSKPRIDGRILVALTCEYCSHGQSLNGANAKLLYAALFCSKRSNGRLEHLAYKKRAHAGCKKKQAPSTLSTVQSNLFLILLLCLQNAEVFVCCQDAPDCHLRRHNALDSNDVLHLGRTGCPFPLYDHIAVHDDLYLGHAVRMKRCNGYPTGTGNEWSVVRGARFCRCCVYPRGAPLKRNNNGTNRLRHKPTTPFAMRLLLCCCCLSTPARVLFVLHPVDVV